MAKKAKHIEDPAALKVRTQVNQKIMQALKAKGFKVRFDYGFLPEKKGQVLQTNCSISKINKEQTTYFEFTGITYWNEEKDVQNRKYARAVAFERAYETYQKYIK